MTDETTDDGVDAETSLSLSLHLYLSSPPPTLSSHAHLWSLKLSLKMRVSSNELFSTFKDMLSDGAELHPGAPLIVLLELSSCPLRTHPDRSHFFLNTQHPFVYQLAACRLQYPQNYRREVLRVLSSDMLPSILLAKVYVIWKAWHWSNST